MSAASKPFTIGLKTEASHRIGYGHLARLKNLLHGWERVQAIWFSREKLPWLEDGSRKVVYRSREEFEQKCEDLDLLLVDEPEFAIDDYFGDSQFPWVGIDEVGDLREVLNLNLITTLEGLEPSRREYGERVELAGARYFIYPPDEPEEIVTEIDKILVSFGGSDPGQITESFLQNVSAETLQYCLFIIGPGFGAKRTEALKSELALKNLSFRISPPSLVGYFKSLPLTIGCGGVSSYEALNFGSYPLFLSQNSEQAGTAQRLEEMGFGTFFGVAQEIDWQMLNQWLRSYLHGERSVSCSGFAKITDGDSTFRVRTILEEYGQSGSLSKI